MVQKKKTQKKSQKQNILDKRPETAVQVVKPYQTPVKVNTKRPANYPVLSFILFIVAMVIWFFVGRQFMIMAVDENLCSIRFDAKLEKSGEIVATIDGDPIYMSEIRNYAASIPQLKELPFEVVYPQLLDTVVNSRMLRKAAQESNVEDQPRVQQAIRSAQDQIIAQAYLEQQLENMVTPAELQARYQSEMENFKPVEEIRARHILVKTEQEAKDIAIQLKAGADFEKLAEKYSLDKSSPNGDLGYYTKDMMIPEFSNATFEMKKGQISNPIKTPFGWHIVQVQDRRQSAQPSFDDIKDDLHQLLIEESIPSLISKERTKMNVIIQKPKI